MTAKKKKDTDLPSEITEPIKAKREMILAKKNHELSLSLAELTNHMRGGNRRTLFFICRLLGHTQEDAAEICGYHRGSGSRLERQMRTSPKYQKEISEVLNSFPEMYRSWAKARLSEVAAVEDRALKAMKEDPTLAVKHPGLLRSIKSATGIQEIDDRPQNVVNVDSLQVIVKDGLRRDTGDVQDAEVVPR